MQSPNPFTSAYKNYITVQLLEILNNKGDYQPPAIEAAEAELASRQLSDEELNEAKNTLAGQKQEKLNQDLRSKTFENKVKDAGSKIIDQLNPIMPRSTEVMIKSICFVLGLSLLYHLYSQFNFIIYLFDDKTTRWDFSILLLILPFIYMPLTIYHFWKRSKTGWSMLSIWLTFIVASAIFEFIVEMKRGEPPGGLMNIIEVLSPRKGPGYYLTNIFLYGGLLYYLNTKTIKEIFSVEKNRQLFCIGFAIIVTSVWWGSLLF